jgi:hypothetical protein
MKTLNFKESMLLKFRWKLKYTFYLSDDKLKKITFGLYWLLARSFFSKRCRSGNARALDRHGAIVLEKKMDDLCLNKVNTYLDNILDDPKKWMICNTKGEFVEKNKINSKNIICERLKALNKIFADQELLEITEKIFGDTLRDYYGCDYKVLCMDSLYLNHIQKASEVEGSFKWHIDNHPPGLIKGFIYLMNVSEENGPFSCLSGSHKKYLKKYELKNDNTDWRFDETIPLKLNIKIKNITGKAGTSFLANANSIHRASPVRKGTRRVLCFMFLPSIRSTFDSYQISKPISSLNAPDRIHEPIW